MIDIPRANLPKALDIPQMYFKPPTADVPAYKPMIVPPAALEAPPETKTDEVQEQPEPPKLQIPVLDIQLPVPETAVVVTAVTTAVVAVATTTVAQTFFEPIQKQVKKQLQKRIDAWKKKRKEKVSSENSKTPQ